MVLYNENKSLSRNVNIINEKNVPMIKANKRAWWILLFTIMLFFSPWNLLISGKSDVDIAAIKKPGIVKRASE